MKTFGLSQVGQYHLDAGSDICQDYNLVEQIADGVCIGVVADGVGSQEHSEIASEAAAKGCVSYCKEHYGEYKDRPLDLLKNAFYSALMEAKKAFEERGEELKDCTLCAVLLTEDAAYCGNSGDSGAIGLKETGEYVLLSTKQNDDEGRVYTLRFEEMWEFAEFEGRFSSILLATDGFYDFLFPSYIMYSPQYDPEDDVSRLDYEYIAKYIDLNTVNKEIGGADLKDYIEGLVNRIPRKGNNWESISDDLTVVVIIDESRVPKVLDKYNVRIDRSDAMRQCTFDNYRRLYPDKELVSLEKGVYPIDQTFFDNDKVVIKSSGSHLISGYTKTYLENNGIDLASPAGDIPEVVLSPIEFKDDGDRFLVALSMELGALPLSMYIPARGRYLSELCKIASSFLETAQKLEGTDYCPYVYTPDAVYTNINTNAKVNSFILSKIADKEKRIPPESPSVDTKVPEGQNITDYSVLKILCYIVTCGFGPDSFEANATKLPDTIKDGLRSALKGTEKIDYDRWKEILAEAGDKNPDLVMPAPRKEVPKQAVSPSPAKQSAPGNTAQTSAPKKGLFGSITGLFKKSGNDASTFSSKNNKYQSDRVILDDDKKTIHVLKEKRRIATIYKSKLTDDEIERLTKVIGLGMANESLPYFECPVDLLISDDRPIGVVSTYIFNESDLKDYLAKTPAVDRRAETAYRLCTVFKTLSEKRIVLDDLSDANLSLGDTNAHIGNIDPLSVRVVDEGDQDAFYDNEMVLDKAVFKLLFNSQEPVVDDTYIYSSDDCKEGLLDPALFPSDLMKVFKDTFEKIEIASPQKMLDALAGYSKNVKRCTKDKIHIYYKDAERCPYCSLTEPPAEETQGEKE